MEPCPCSPHLLTHGATLSHPELHCPTEDGGHPSPRRPPPEGLLPHTEGQPGTLPRRPAQPPAPGPPCWQRYPLLPEDKGLQLPAARPGPLPVSSQAGAGVSCWHPEGWGGTQNPWGSFQLAACILGSTSAKGTRGRGQRGWSEFSFFLDRGPPSSPTDHAGSLSPSRRSGSQPVSPHSGLHPLMFCAGGSGPSTHIPKCGHRLPKPRSWEMSQLGWESQLGWTLSCACHSGLSPAPCQALGVKGPD